MKKLLIGKDIAYGKAEGGAANGAITPDLLDNGSIGIYGLDPTTNNIALITVATTATGKIPASDFKGNIIQIFQGLGGGKVRGLGDFDLDGFNKSIYSAYAAPSYGALYVGYNETAGDVALDIDANSNLNQASIKVVERNRGNNDRDYYYFTVPVATDATKNSVTASLVAKINADDRGLFTATQTNSGSAYGVKLVPKDYTRIFEVVAQEVLEGSTIKVTAPSSGSGTPAILKDLQLESDIRRGLVRKDIFDKTFDSYVDSSKTYDVYELAFMNRTKDSFLGGQPGMTENVKVLVAFEVQADVVGTNQQADWDDILNILDQSKKVGPQGPQGEPGT